ncbi:glycosyltransferase family 4 protein [Nocardioides daphniae]|uniref:GDP-mannose-dependent alpha-mannosyltransferase n=1 Tax=Nocardioides daphniae TaxID=402297 RepID=A0A4V1CWK9_9ACTN|nr:glycosyltransferase family 1 protein [Nocardioides daphniae]QCC77627.1 glycosyltransferase family 1 protein [Nocardioides daphniae]GGD30022.1 GDP-mannose-dependent alpha-mannosyltransferase [Nocardioides daphniae]
MRVVIVTESFFPQVNGVTNSVRHVVDRLLATGHQPLVIAPGPGPSAYRNVPVVRVRSMALPRYASFPVGLPDPVVERTMAEFRPDVVHLASPIALGAIGLKAAQRLGIPTVAIYQTDISGFAKQYGLRAEPAISRWVGRIHRRADRTLAPSTVSMDQLRGMGVGDLHRWGRGVDLDLFSPARRCDDLREKWTRGDRNQVVIGYVGRLAAEKQVRRLAALGDLPGTRLVVVGDGPERALLGRALPGARFTGMLGGEDLARAFASLDVFVHTGEAETFCQTVQEAQASGVPVVAPAAGGPLDLVDHGRTGLLYTPGSGASLRRSVERLTDDAELRSRLGSAGCDAVSRRSWADVVDELVQHYAAVVRTPLLDAA